MKIARLGLLGAVYALACSGCAVLNSRAPAPRPQPIAQRTFPVDRFVAEHNRNADRIESLTARPTVGVTGKLTGRADGRLAMERPRNFKLELLRIGNPFANIGSNDQEFWFWVKNDGDEKAVYWCDYDQLESSALPLSYQPDWIVEALGLKPISKVEAAAIRVQPGSERGTTALIFPPTKTRAGSFTRVMIVWDNNRRIKEYRILAPDRRTVLAQATIWTYAEHEIDDAGKGSSEVYVLPESARLEWKREQLSLDVSLRDVKINQFDSSDSETVFVEPKIAGYARVNLAEQSRSGGREAGATTRHTMPAPERRADRGGVKLGRPAPLDDDGVEVPRLESPLSTRPRPAAPPFEDVVGAPRPSPPNSDIYPSGPALWAGATSP
jgi:hypothetical protein